jgi:hypothetical protein
MMRRAAVLAGVSLLVFAAVSSLAAEKDAKVAGTWMATVRMPDHTVNEEWTIRQKGQSVTGTVKNKDGERTFAGTVDGLFFRVDVKDGEKVYKVRATVDGDTMDGSITFGAGDEHLWSAKRAGN